MQRKQRFSFYASILSLFLVTVGTLSGLLIYIGDRSSNAIRQKSIEAQIFSAEQGVEIFTNMLMSIVSRVHQTVSKMPAATQKRLISGESIELLLPAVVPAHRGLLAPVSTMLGFKNGDFFYFSDTDHLDKNLIIDGNIPDKTKFIALTIENTDGKKNARWWFYDKNMHNIGLLPFGEINYDPREQEWYKLAETEGHSILSQPYVFATTGKVGTTFATPIPYGGGVISSHISATDMARVMEAFKITPSSVAFIVSENQNLIYHPTLSSTFVSTDAVTRPATLSDYTDPILQAVLTHIKEGEIGETFNVQVDEKKYVTYVGELLKQGGFHFFTALATPEEELTADIDRMHQQSILVVAAVLLASILILFFIASFVSRPINRLCMVAQKIAELDLNATRPVDSRIKEVAYLSDTMDRMRESITTFSQYVPRQLVKRILANNDAARLGGQRREVTTLFSDVQEFSTVSETMDPEEMLPLISNYFQVMTDCIMNHNGIVDKFIGDAVMAIWNAPDDDPDHILHACQAALAAKEKLEKFNEELTARGIKPFFTRIGINTGICIVGNVGSDDRKDYTIFGPMVNIAARLEALNREYNTQILVSEILYEKVKERFEFRYVDQVIPKGTSQSMGIYELVKEQI